MLTDYLVADQHVQTTIFFITRSKDVADSEAYRSGDYRLEPKEIDVERKLTTVGPLPERIDRDEIYARIRGDATTAIQGDQE